jgi:hypothetical protein
MFEVGTVSHGTMRVEDVLPKLLNLLPAPERVALKNAYARPLAHMVNDEELTEEDQMDLDYLCWEVLFDRLNALAPEGTYFGAHPGDGSDYGFWPIEEETDDEILDRHLSLIPSHLGGTGV